jgi:hypothetical protein
MEPLASLVGLNYLYFASLAIGGAYATIILLTGAVHDIYLPHFDFSGAGHVEVAPGHGMPAVENGPIEVPAEAIAALVRVSRG